MTNDTPALAALARLGIAHEVVRTRRARDVADAADLRDVPVAALVKTLVVRRGEDDYLMVMVPGDRVLDWSKLRNHLGVRRLSLPDAAEAQAATGYERGTITPFGARTPWPVIADATLLSQPVVAIGGGAHGVAVRMSPAVMLAALGAEPGDVTRSAT